MSLEVSKDTKLLSLFRSLSFSFFFNHRENPFCLWFLVSLFLRPGYLHPSSVFTLKRFMELLCSSVVNYRRKCQFIKYHSMQSSKQPKQLLYQSHSNVEHHGKAQTHKSNMNQLDQGKKKYLSFCLHFRAFSMLPIVNKRWKSIKIQ